jgi:hypothetical protein
MSAEFDGDHLVESLLAEDSDLFSSLQSLETFEGGSVERAVRVASAEARLEEHGTLATYGPIGL